jgi:hypothetical protein
MFLSAVSMLVVAQPSLEVLEGLMNYPVFFPVVYQVYHRESKVVA